MKGRFFVILLPVVFFGLLAQLVRALPSHGRGRWFESSTAHHTLGTIPFFSESSFILFKLDSNLKLPLMRKEPLLAFAQWDLVFHLISSG